MEEKPAKIGRPPKLVKEINPVRQVGRWPDEQWDVIREAAKDSKLSIAEWARGILLKAAKRKPK